MFFFLWKPCRQTDRHSIRFYKDQTFLIRLKFKIVFSQISRSWDQQTISINQEREENKVTCPNSLRGVERKSWCLSPFQLFFNFPMNMLRNSKIQIVNTFYIRIKLIFNLCFMRCWWISTCNWKKKKRRGHFLTNLFGRTLWETEIEFVWSSQAARHLSCPPL